MTRELTSDEVDEVDEIAEADYQAALQYHKGKKEKTAEQKIEFAETGLVELNIKVPRLTPLKAKPIMRDIKRALENCGSLSLLDEFAMTLRVEYIEIPVEGVKQDGC